MTGIPLLHPDRIDFPDPMLAMDEPDGLLAAGGDLTTDWLLTAYSMGIFPWYNDDNESILWWSPAERAVLVPGELKVSRSLAKRIKNAGFEVSMDQEFGRVVQLCSAPRRDSSGTWITPNMSLAYNQLHQSGFAHSVEVYLDDKLVGGLYGVSLGRMFFGESMFSTVADASKVALYHLQQQLCTWGFELIDCQLENPHLTRLGVTCIPRDEFLQRLSQNDMQHTRTGSWSFDIS